MKDVIFVLTLILAVLGTHHFTKKNTLEATDIDYRIQQCLEQQEDEDAKEAEAFMATDEVEGDTGPAEPEVQAEGGHDGEAESEAAPQTQTKGD